MTGAVHPLIERLMHLCVRHMQVQVLCASGAVLHVRRTSTDLDSIFRGYSSVAVAPEDTGRFVRGQRMDAEGLVLSKRQGWK